MGNQKAWIVVVKKKSPDAIQPEDPKLSFVFVRHLYK